MWLMIIAAVATVLVTAVSWFVISRFLSAPLGKLVSHLDSLTKGDTDVQIGVEYDDEIGKVAVSLEIFRQKLIENAKMQEDELTRQQEIYRARPKAGTTQRSVRHQGQSDHHECGERDGAVESDRDHHVERVGGNAAPEQRNPGFCGRVFKQHSVGGRRGRRAHRLDKGNRQTNIGVVESLPTSGRQRTRRENRSGATGRKRPEDWSGRQPDLGHCRADKISWRSMRRSRRPAPARWARASRSSPMK